MMVAVVFVAETVPRFGAVLDLIGGSTITVLTFIFPCMFYMWLNKQHAEKGNAKRFSIAWNVCCALLPIGGRRFIYTRCITPLRSSDVPLYLSSGFSERSGDNLAERSSIFFYLEAGVYQLAPSSESTPFYTWS